MVCWYTWPNRRTVSSPMSRPVICRPRGNPSLKPQGTDSSGAPARFARFVNVRCCEIMARLNSSLLPNPGLSTIGGATSAEVRNIRRSMVVSSVVSYAGQGNFLDRRSLVFCYIRRREHSVSYFLVYVVRIDGSFTMPAFRPLTLSSRSLT